MTLDEARTILRICQQHGLPTPKIRPALRGNDERECRWSTSRMSARVIGFKAAKDFCRCMYREKKVFSL